MNIVGLLLIFAILTTIFVFYIKEVKAFRAKEAEMKKQIKYYMKELEKRSGNENVDLH